MYDVRAVANWFLDKAEECGDELTAMKLQKLAYVSHGWYLAIAGHPLVHDAVEAWKWGAGVPVSLSRIPGVRKPTDHGTRYSFRRIQSGGSRDYTWGL